MLLSVSDQSESVSDFVPFGPISSFATNGIWQRKTMLLVDQTDVTFLVPAASTFNGLKFNFRPFFIGFSKNEFVKP